MFIDLCDQICSVERYLEYACHTEVEFRKIVKKAVKFFFVIFSINDNFLTDTKDRRHYAAIEAEKLGHGGITYISDLFGCSRQTVHDGIEELKKKH